MRVLGILLLVFVTGCWSGWEKDPVAEKGLPYDAPVDDLLYQAPSPAALGLKIKQLFDGGAESEVIGLIQAREGSQVRIAVQGQNFDPAHVHIEDIVVQNQDALPGATLSYDPSATQLLIDWDIPERFVLGVRQNFFVSPPVRVRLRARFHSTSPEGVEQVDYRQVDSSFNVIVFREFHGLQPNVVGMEPEKVGVIENKKENFDVIVDVPGSATANQLNFKPDVRIVSLNFSTQTKRDGSPYVGLDLNKAATQVDPDNNPTLWRIPVMVDLRGREVTEKSDIFYFGVQAISKYAPDNNWICDASGECEYKEVASFVSEHFFTAFTKIESPETSMTFAPTVQAGRHNFVQWQVFDPEGYGEVETQIRVCPSGAVCSCTPVVRQAYVRCGLEWQPECSSANVQTVEVRARTVSRVGPDQASSYKNFRQNVRVLKDHCGEQP